jgi:glyoxylase-like metal-dependent hydrolase (beta-lactamase superfamily II)/8-oxo-dGTP pyrophosphatase MutT (NUDIX family)
MNSTHDIDIYADSRKAASVIILRDRPQGSFEVLMMRRPERGNDFRSGAVVFPGGVMEARDRLAHAHCLGWDDAQASARMGLPEGGLDYFVAAVRECFEEVGLLFGGVRAAAHSHQAVQRAHAQWRSRLQSGQHGLHELCEDLQWQLDLSQWAYFAHWLTPLGRPKRFDTRFFVTIAPEGQEAQADSNEAVELMWVSPQEAMEAQRGYKLLPVTRRNLSDLAKFSSAQAVLDHARGLREIPMILPRLANSAKGERILHPSDFAWAEVGRLDPLGKADAFADIVPGRLVKLSERVWRLTAPNPGMMTGPGTNTYLVADPATRRVTVIDPGPDDEQHAQAIVHAAPGPIERIVVTHTHRDHSPGARALAALCSAPVFGRLPDHATGQDTGFEPTGLLQGGERLALGPHTHLLVVHTPGHASNHLCFLLEEEKTLFCGDHLMQGSTVVINPPDGQMKTYLHSLHALLALDLEWLAPGHGFLVAQPHRVVHQLVAHRLAREAKVVAALASMREASLQELVVEVYRDVDPQLHGVATRSLLAHLFKLQDDGRTQESSGRWRWIN